jgi:two-component system sensor kinase FixL
MYLSVGEGAFNGDRIFVAIIRDLTERQATERRLQELQTELLHVSRLSDMGQMSSALAHELNQPLAAITNYVNAARRTLDNDGPESLSRAKDLMDKATAQTLRAGTIIRNLRAFVAKRDGQRTREGINRVVDEAIALSFTGTADLHVKVTRRLAPKLQPVLIDKVQIQQVLINLIRNSIEAMATVEDRELTAVTEADEEHGVTVTIADTGPGLSPDVLPRLFQPFVTTKESGMGLGLTICQSIVESHGGRIWVLNPDTPGAGFAFHLPFASTGEK